MNSIIQEKTFNFAVRIVNLNKYLAKMDCEHSLRTQLLKSGTSIGANVQEAINGQSKKDFIAKLHISLKECKECQYWLKLLNKTGFLEDKHFQDINKDAVEIDKILTSIILTTKDNLLNS